MKKVTRVFLNGILKGLTYTENTNLNYELNQTIDGYTEKYRIIKIEEAI